MLPFLIVAKRFLWGEPPRLSGASAAKLFSSDSEFFLSLH